VPVSIRHFIATATAVLILATGLVGCDSNGPVWVNEQKVYTTRTVGAILDVADISRFEERATADAPDLRHAALTSLRKNGDDASGVADLLTRTFEPSTRGVPVYVELASIDGTEAVIVVEATGPKSGRLDSKRLWALDTDGNVILARSR